MYIHRGGNIKGWFIRLQNGKITKTPLKRMAVLGWGVNGRRGYLFVFILPVTMGSKIFISLRPTGRICSTHSLLLDSE